MAFITLIPSPKQGTCNLSGFTVNPGYVWKLTHSIQNTENLETVSLIEYIV